MPADLAPDAVVFAVKPQVIDELLPAYRRWVAAGNAVSVDRGGQDDRRHRPPSRRRGGDHPLHAEHAGRDRARDHRRLPESACRAATAPLCEQLLAAIGDSAWVEDEALMDAVTAVSGSGPAYVFLLIEALAAAGARAGLPPELSLRLARATVAGAGELALVSSETPARLRENVTSPGGTTRAALDVLMAEPGLPELLDRAVAAATARSRELAN